MPAAAWPAAVRLRANTPPPNFQPVHGRGTDPSYGSAIGSPTTRIRLGFQYRSRFDRAANHVSGLPALAAHPRALSFSRLEHRSQMVALKLLQTGTPTATVAAVLRRGSQVYPAATPIPRITCTEPSAVPRDRFALLFFPRVPACSIDPHHRTRMSCAHRVPCV